MYGYGVEMLIYILFFLTASADQLSALRSHTMIFWQFEFAIKSTIQAMAGSDTRTIFLQILRRVDVFRLEFMLLH